MRRIIAAVVLMFGLAAPAWAGFDEGVAAYTSGDYATALREWRPLAEQGDAKAQYNLGLMYAKGEGVPQEFVQAHMWFNIAAARTLYRVFNGGWDDMLARTRRDEIAKRMTPAQIAEAQILARVWWAKRGKK